MWVALLLLGATPVISGPDKAALNTEVRLSVTQFTAPSTIPEAIDWAKKVTLFAIGPPNECRATLGIGIGTGGWNLDIVFRATTSDVYDVILLIPGDTLVFHRIKAGQGPQPPPPPPPPVDTPADSAVYIYDKDLHTIPAKVLAALNKLHISEFEVHSVNGKGEVPVQYRVPFAEATKAGLPALVVMSGGKVTKVVVKPQTDTDIEGALK